MALILSAIYSLLRKSYFNRAHYLIALATTLVIVIFDINPIYMIILGIIISVIYNKYKRSRSFDDFDE